VRRLATAAAIGLLGLLLAEGVLRLAALAAPALLARRTERGNGTTFRILCLGDSHTYGWGVERAEAWPAQLQSLLDAAGAPVRFEVTNLGIPGSNSAQLLAALPTNLARYAPDLLIVATGGNDVVNQAGLDAAPDAGALQRLHRVLWDASRLYRLVVLAVHDRALRGVPRAEGAPELRWTNPLAAVEVHHGRSVERLEHRIDWGVFLEPAEHERITRRNLEAIVRVAREARVPIVLASYVHPAGPHGVANRAMREIPGALFVSQTWPDDLAAQLPPLGPQERSRGLFLPDLHPRPPVYAAYAAHLRDALVAAQLVPTWSPSPSD
jgi:lysophospholipase L1-like esterase